MGKFDGVLLASDFDNTLLYTEDALRTGGPVPPLPERHREAILEYLAGAGFAYRQDIVDLLHIQPKQCTLVLHRMVEEGALVQLGQKYFLPEREKRKAE